MVAETDVAKLISEFLNASLDLVKIKECSEYDCKLDKIIYMIKLRLLSQAVMSKGDLSHDL